MGDLEARVRSAIAAERLVGDAARIAVSADEIGTVTLRGAVPTHAQSHAAAHAARGVPDVFDVINEIEVKPLDALRSADVPYKESAAAEPASDAGRGPEVAEKKEAPDDVLQQLLRESRALKKSEERVEKSVSEELRREHWGREPEDPPPWDMPAGGSEL
jgi:hypothetical protein